MENFKEILQAILNKTIDYGKNREYYLFLSEDGDLYLLKKNEDTPPEGFVNEYSGEEIWSSCYNDWETYKMFMDALGIENNC